MYLFFLIRIVVIKELLGQVWWYMPALRKLRQVD
jgi:hypothetical protein